MSKPEWMIEYSDKFDYIDWGEKHLLAETDARVILALYKLKEKYTYMNENHLFFIELRANTEIRKEIFNRYSLPEGAIRDHRQILVNELELALEIIHELRESIEEMCVK